MSIITKKSQQPSVVVHLQVPGNTRKIKIPKICMKLIPCFKKYTKKLRTCLLETRQMRGKTKLKFKNQINASIMFEHRHILRKD